MIAELLFALQLLDGVKQRDGITPSGTPTEQKPQEQFVTGVKKFIGRIKNPFKRN
jgi:hypothetical protein